MAGNRGSLSPVQEQWNDGIAVTTSDSTANLFNSLLIAATGNLKITTPSGNVLTFTGLPAGAVIPIPTALVWATGTTATVVGLPV
jgi:hypothetical protein